MSAFGTAPEEQLLTDQIDEDYDILNDETFGGEVPNEEWEGEGEGEVESGEEASILAFAASKLPITSDDPLEFLEQSLSHLVDDDDDAPRNIIRSGHTKPLTDIFTSGSPQTPFFMLDKDNIWSDPAVKPNKPTHGEAAMSGLMMNMRLNGAEGMRQTPVQRGEPVLVKGAKTAEELEAEMLGKSAPSTQPKIIGSSVKSCQELERELIESSRAAAGGAAMKTPVSNVSSAVSQVLQGLPPVPPVPNPLMHPPPHPMLANPQVRAALMARWLASNPGAVPPVWFRLPPPPPMMPPRGAGFRPPVIRPGPNVPPVNFQNVRLPQGMAPRQVGLVFQQGGARRSSPSFPKRRLFDSPGGQRSGGMHEDNYESKRERGDPFAGLMTRRERSWLMKIQSLQLYSENPYVDDYYWMMYRQRKLAGDGKKLLCKDKDDNDKFEHRTYIPPSFEGSLGKVQVLSANFPRQLLDLTASAANGEMKDQSTVDESSLRDSPIAKLGTVAGFRRLKNMLMEIENLYIMLMEANEIKDLQKKEAMARASMEEKEKATSRVKHLIQTIITTLLNDDHIVGALSIRKGRRLLLQLLAHCDKEDCLNLMKAVMRNLLPLSKKEPNHEVLSGVKAIVDTNLTGMDGNEWSSIWNATKPEIIDAIVKYKLGSLLLLMLIQRSAADNAKLDDEARKVVECWAAVMFTNITNSNSNEYQRALELDKCEIDSIGQWLANLSNASIPATVIEAIKTYLVGQTKA